MMTDLAYLSIAEGSQLLRARKLSPVEWTRALLDRIAAIDANYNAFLAVTADQALAQAKAAEAEIAKGQWRGPMHGVPYAAKDIFDIEGMATTCHSKIRMNHRAAADAFVVRKLREAGAVLLGKAALHEFATGGPAFDLPWPPARNPWNRDLHPGGSSSGSAVALAAGFAPAALGTDTGGSVRNPATCCGIIGMKPTYGAVSLGGVFPLTYSLDHADAQTFHAALEAGEAIAGFAPRAGRIVRIMAGDGVEQNRIVLDIARHRPDVIERIGQREHAAEADRAVSRFHSDDAATSRGIAHRAAGIGAERGRRKACRERHRRAARRAARMQVAVPGIAGGRPG